MLPHNETLNPYKNHFLVFAFNLFLVSKTTFLSLYSIKIEDKKNDKPVDINNIWHSISKYKKKKIGVINNKIDCVKDILTTIFGFKLVWNIDFK